MTDGIFTEREWRRQGAGFRTSMPSCWGAQWVRPQGRKNLHQNRALHKGMLATALAIALLIPLCFARRAQRPLYPMAVVPASSEAVAVRIVPGISYVMPSTLALSPQTYTAEELYRGRMLLLDEEHPLPMEAPAPNTLTIATHGKGMVPVGDLSLKSGRETIQALKRLFAELRSSGTGGFLVWQATQTLAEQQASRQAYMQQQAAQTSLEVAAKTTLMATDSPASGELQQEYTVELRFLQAGAHQPDQRPLEETVPGRKLLQVAWRNGFVRTHPGAGGPSAFRFRYVGKAHATAMTYLGLDLCAYLDLLHQRRVMLVKGEGGELYVIQCVPVTGHLITFSLPAGATHEVSMDNTGYAIAASTLPLAKATIQ